MTGPNKVNQTISHTNYFTWYEEFSWITNYRDSSRGIMSSILECIPQGDNIHNVPTFVHGYIIYSITQYLS